MHLHSKRVAAAAVPVLIAAALIVRAESSDPLAAEIARWSAFVKSEKAKGEMWDQFKAQAATMLGRADTALKDGRRWLALQRYAAVRSDLEAAASVSARTADEQKDLARFESEWKRHAALSGEPKRLDDVQPAAVRALAEAAVPQVRGYYEASLEYGRSTTAQSGWYYLAAAQAQRSFLDFARTVSEKTSRRAPALRSLAPDLDALERELLAAYRPPASIDRHTEFILASSMLKEARELDARGLRYGALIRYLEAARRTGTIVGKPSTVADLAPQLQKLEERLADKAVDHSIGQIYAEAAQTDLAAPPETGPASATAVVSHVLPRYFAAIGPAPAAKAAADPRVTVTLVRWPYT